MSVIDGQQTWAVSPDRGFGVYILAYRGLRYERRTGPNTLPDTGTPTNQIALPNASLAPGQAAVGMIGSGYWYGQWFASIPSGWTQRLAIGAKYFNQSGFLERPSAAGENVTGPSATITTTDGAHRRVAWSVVLTPALAAPEPVIESGLVPGYAYRWTQTLADRAGNTGTGTSGCVLIDPITPSVNFISPEEDSTAYHDSSTYEVSWVEDGDGSAIVTRSLQRQKTPLATPLECDNASWADDGSPVATESPVVINDLNYFFCYRWTQTIVTDLGPSATSTSGIVVVQHSAIWGTANATVTVQRGASDQVSVTLTATQSVAGASLTASAALTPFMPLLPEDPFDLQAGADYAVPLQFDIPSSTTAGTYVGTLSMTAPGQQTFESLSVEVTVVDPPSEVVPIGVSMPSAHRVETDAYGGALVIDELLVGLDRDVSDVNTRILAIASVHEATVLGSVAATRTYQLWFPDVSDLAELEAVRLAILAESDVTFAATSHLATASDIAPNDPLWDVFDEANPGGNNWHLEMIRAPSGWSLTTGGRSVGLAVIDADIDTDHPDLAANVDAHVGVQRPRPDNPGHGTHVAGIACAVGNNNVGVSGVAWECSLRAHELAVVVMFPDEGDWQFFLHPLQVQQRMTEAYLGGARVINLSAGNSFGSCAGVEDPNADARVAQHNDIYAQPILNAIADGFDVLWVFSAGNANCDARLVSPASLASIFDNVIAVASSNHHAEKSSFSNFGDVITVAAPGGETTFLDTRMITSTTRPDCLLFFIPICPQPYGEKVGTSMAAPQVSGLAVLVLSIHDIPAALVKSCIVQGADVGGVAVPGHAFHVIDIPSTLNCDLIPEPGMVWTPHPTDPAPFTGRANFRWSAFGGGRWLVGGNGGGDIWYATDVAATWTLSDSSSAFTTGTDSHIEAAYYGGGHWVAVGWAGRLATSPDGISWSLHPDSSFAGSAIFDVRYANGLWVAVGQHGKLATASDPTGAWTQRDAGFGASSIWSVLHGDGLWIVAGADNKWAKATDGITWVQQSPFSLGVPADLAGDRIAFGDGTWVFVTTASGGVKAAIWTSPDAVTWSKQAEFECANIGRPVFGGGLWVLDADLTGNCVYTLNTSTDLAGWTERFTPNPDTGQTRALAYDGVGTWVHAGMDPYILYSR